MISTASDLIDELGGTGEVAGLLKVRDNTVSTWRTRGFPAWAHKALQGAAEEAGLSVDGRLFEIAPRRSAA